MADLCGFGKPVAEVPVGYIPAAAADDIGDMSDLTTLPPGMVGRHEAARMIGVAGRTFSAWEKQGRIRCGRLVAPPDVSTSCPRLAVHRKSEMRFIPSHSGCSL